MERLAFRQHNDLVVLGKGDRRDVVVELAHDGLCLLLPTQKQRAFRRLFRFFTGKRAWILAAAGAVPDNTSVSSSALIAIT
jgi:hypothetical protein